ncbi:ABC transporter permease [Candidatus Dojkabacteria bacterium]|nr:ABC transporter permease [Candidatus Dojkabacteria bacterium]
MQLTLVLICITIGALQPVFLSLENISNILVQVAVISIISVGMTFVIISGGIDLSVGSVVAFSGMVLGYFLKSGHSIVLAIMLCMLVGFVCGVINGVIISAFKVPPFISTLGMMSVARGLALMVRGGRSISGFSDVFLCISNGTFLGIPWPIVIMFLIYLIAFVVSKYTYWGHYICAIGGNKRASWLSGIPIKIYIILIYGACGLLSAIASIILTARLNSAQPIAGNSYELDAIAAAVIGGASLSGGRGSICGTLVGALILAVLKNGLSILNIPSYTQQVAIGSMIVIAVVVDKVRERKLI